MSVDAELDRFLATVERRAFRMAQLALHDVDDALDAVQDAMLALVRRYAQRAPEEWPPLFWRILSRRITDVHRARQRRGRLFGLFPRAAADDDTEDAVARIPAGPEASPELALEAQATGARLEAIVAALPLRQQQALLLRSWEGLSVADTALAMGCAEGSVKTHLSRALERLRKELGGDHEQT